MAVMTYSRKKDGNTKLSANFYVKEFACKDGTDMILISRELVEVLQKIRNYFKKPVTITSGYRTPSHNKKIGGASGSKHTKGLAADIKVSGTDPLKVAWYANEVLGVTGGVECGSYDSGTQGYNHIDVRTLRWRAIKPTSSGKYTTYTGKFLPTVKYGSSGAHVTVLSRKLKKLGYMSTVCEKCNNMMSSAIKSFQAAHNLTSDGICGKDTWKILCKEI